MKLLLVLGALPFVLLLLSVLPQLRKRSYWLPILGVSALVGAGCFMYVQAVLNSPDAGREFEQFYLPLIIYGLVFAGSAVVFAVNRRRAVE